MQTDLRCFQVPKSGTLILYDYNQKPRTLILTPKWPVDKTTHLIGSLYSEIPLTIFSAANNKTDEIIRYTVH